MLSMLPDLVAGLAWEPNIKGGLYVVIAFVVLCGSPYLLLSTNSGARLGFLLAGAGLFGFMVIIGAVWWVYGIGPKGRTPVWHPETTITGNLDQVESGVLGPFPTDWTELELSDKKVADAQPVVDGVLTGNADEGVEGLFEAPSEYVAAKAYRYGGESYGPLGLNFRPLNLFHKASYLVVQVQPAKHVEPEPGKALPKPEADPSAQPVSVLLVRDLGSLRLNPAIATIASAMIFGLFVYQLHVRDKEIMAKAAAGRSVTT